MVEVGYPSVNDGTTNAAAPMTSMSEVRSVLPRIIHAFTTTRVGLKQFLFAKFDIKDGFWLMVMPKDDELNFLPSTYSPKLSDEETSDPQIVVPLSLLM